MRRINRCLNKQLVNLCHRAAQLDELNLKVKQLLPANLQEHCHVGSFNKGYLLLMVEKAEWATELRYCLPELRDNLRKKAGMYQLISIEVLIGDAARLAKSVKHEIARSPSLSATAREACRNASELCSYDPLKKVLLHLAGD